MLGLSVRLPHTSTMPSEASMDEVLARAIEAANDIGGAFATSPCTFRVVPLDTEDTATWVLVTHARSPEPDHEAHLRERTRTAVQRFMLSVQCEGLDAVWIPDEAAVEAAYTGARLNPAQDAGVGLVRCSPLG